MNIFVLDVDPTNAARYHADKHVVKMILETTQLMNNALCINDPDDYVPVYGTTHVKHPATLWAAMNVSNFRWLAALGRALCKEYTFRYGKVHACSPIIGALSEHPSLKRFSTERMTPFVLCMPDEFKTVDPVESYRRYYVGAKSHIARWKHGNEPEWWKNASRQ